LFGSELTRALGKKITGGYHCDHNALAE